MPHILPPELGLFTKDKWHISHILSNPLDNNTCTLRSLNKLRICGLNPFLLSTSEYVFKHDASKYLMGIESCNNIKYSEMSVEAFYKLYLKKKMKGNFS